MTEAKAQYGDTPRIKVCPTCGAALGLEDEPPLVNIGQHFDGRTSSTSPHPVYVPASATSGSVPQVTQYDLAAETFDRWRETLPAITTALAYREAASLCVALIRAVGAYEEGADGE